MQHLITVYLFKIKPTTLCFLSFTNEVFVLKLPMFVAFACIVGGFVCFFRMKKNLAYRKTKSLRRTTFFIYVKTAY